MAGRRTASCMRRRGRRRCRARRSEWSGGSWRGPRVDWCSGWWRRRADTAMTPPRTRCGPDVGQPTKVGAMDLPLDADARPASEMLDVDDVIDDVVGRLPEAFREQLGSVAIVIEDEATPDQLASVRAHGLYGLYQGVPRTRWGVDNVPIPSKITLFLGPLTRANPTPERLRGALEDTLLHEIAHHLGIDDARLRELQMPRSDRRRGG